MNIEIALTPAAKPVALSTLSLSVDIASEFAHLADDLTEADARCDAARQARATIETINDGPRCLGWHYKATPGTPRSLLRTGWHAVGEPCPTHVSDAILQEVKAAAAAWQEVVVPIKAAVRAAVPDRDPLLVVNAVLRHLRAPRDIVPE